MKNKGFGSAVFDTVNYIIMVFVVVVTVYPMLYVIFASVSDGTQFLKHSGLLLRPLGFNITAYKEVFKNSMIVSGYVTTLIVLFVGVPLNILLTSFGAYFLSRKEIMLSKAVMIVIMITMFFSGGMIPFYLVVKGLGLYDNILALILPSAIATFNLIIMNTSFQGIPVSLIESSKIDGANDLVVLFRIIMPLSCYSGADIVLCGRALEFMV